MILHVSLFDKFIIIIIITYIIYYSKLYNSKFSYIICMLFVIILNPYIFIKLNLYNKYIIF